MIDPKMTSRLKLLGACFRSAVSRLRRHTVALALGVALVGPAVSRAQEEEVKHDARLDGYDTKVQVDSDNTALTWILLLALSAVALGVMFKNAKRSHLD